MAKKTYLSSASRTDGAFAPVNVLEIGDPSQPTELILHNGKMYVYDADGQTTIDGGVVQAIGIAAGAISASKLVIGQRAYVTTVSFTPSHRNRVVWTAGTIYFTGGEERDIEAGNTGYLSGKVYIYYDGTSYLRVTSDEATATAGNRAVLAIVTPVDDSSDLALIKDFKGGGTTMSGDKITTGHISAERIWIGIQSFVTDIPFTSVNAAKVSWSAGTIKFVDGTSKSVNAGNTGNLNQRTTVYSVDGNTLALWHLNETSGTNCDNVEGDASWDLTASATGTVNSDGKFDYCRLLNGSSEYLSVTDYSEMDQTTFTWEGWFKTSEYAEQAILSREPSGSALWPYRVLITSSGYLQFDIKVNSGLTYTLTSQSVVNDGNWHNFAAVFDAENDTMQLWIDGIKHAEATNCTTDPPASSEALSIGRSITSSYFKGRIDELRFSNVARTYTAADKRYIYYNNSVVLAVTTTYSDAVGTKKLLMAIIIPKINYGGCEMQIMGNDGTIIDGNQIRTGRISSSDGRTYFDLDNNRLIMNVDGNDILLLGYGPGLF